MSEYIITTKQIEELNKANCGMQIVTSWLSAYAIFDTSGFPPFMKSQHLAITLPNVVRCKDCKFGENDGTECMRPDGDGDYLRMPVDPDGFCAWGEKVDA